MEDRRIGGMYRWLLTNVLEAIRDTDEVSMAEALAKWHLEEQIPRHTAVFNV